MPIKNVLYLSKAQFEELVTNGSITIDDTTITYSTDDMQCIPSPVIHHIQVNGTADSDDVKLSFVALLDPTVEINTAALLKSILGDFIYHTASGLHAASGLMVWQIYQDINADNIWITYGNGLKSILKVTSVSDTIDVA